MRAIKSEFDKKDTLFMKGIAILFMLFYHLFETEERLITLQVDFRPFSKDLFLMLSGFGNICVAIFVFLSAYGISKGLMQCIRTEKEKYKEAFLRCGKLILNFMVMYLSVNLLWFSYFDYGKLYGQGWQGLMLACIDMLGFSQLFGTPTLNMTWWYMELAILFIFIVPVFFKVVEKLGNYSLMLPIVMVFAIELNSDVERYIFVMALGVVAAKEKWFEKIYAMKCGFIMKSILGLMLILFSVLCRQNYMVHSYFLWLIDGFVALLLCWYGTEVVELIPILRQVLIYIGKHSMNIFFVHTFFYMSIYQPYIYAPRYAGLIFIGLIVVSLLYSVILELLKKLGKKYCRFAIHS